MTDSGERLEIAALDPSGTLDQVLDHVDLTADRVRKLRAAVHVVQGSADSP